MALSDQTSRLFQAPLLGAPTSTPARALPEANRLWSGSTSRSPSKSPVSRTRRCALGRGSSGAAILSIDKALRDIDWTPEFGIEDGYRDSYAWFVREGRGRYEFDFSRDDALLAQFGR